MQQHGLNSLKGKKVFARRVCKACGQEHIFIDYRCTGCNAIPYVPLAGMKGKWSYAQIRKFNKRQLTLAQDRREAFKQSAEASRKFFEGD